MSLFVESFSEQTNAEQEYVTVNITNVDTITNISLVTTTDLQYCGGRTFYRYRLVEKSLQIEYLLIGYEQKANEGHLPRIRLRPLFS